MPRIKICCISSIEEASLAIKFGASAIGLVGHMPSGPGILDDVKIQQIARCIPPPIGSFLLTSETDVSKIIEHHKKVNTNTIQIVDTISKGSYSDLRKYLPSISIVQVIHVMDESSIEMAMKISPHVDAILLDSGNTTLKIKELGGTGRIHNWKLSRKIVENISKPVFLAGGINAKNVRQAIDEVNPFGIDLCSGVRSDGHLDLRKLEAFFNAVNK